MIPVEITVYSDRSFTFVTKTPPAAILLKKAAGIAKGSSDQLKEKVGFLEAEVQAVKNEIVEREKAYKTELENVQQEKEKVKQEIAGLPRVAVLGTLISLAALHVRRFAWIKILNS